jgi:Zn-dependent peptidase ImmA (M78 family)
MKQVAQGMNPEVLKWAREKAHYSVNDIALRLNKDPEVILAWEGGSELPTYIQLEKIAYEIYKRPIAIFFFPSPPVEADSSKSFRTVPEHDLQLLLPDTQFALRQAEAMQLSLYELMDNHRNISNRIIFRDIKLNEYDSIIASTHNLRNYLGVSLKTQFSWKKPEYALELWRDIIQELGIFVFKRSFKEEGISGFCLLDDEFPLIYLNNSMAHTRQIFSLFHELSHILMGENGMTFQNDSYIHHLSSHYKKIETFCNRFTAEFLVPSSFFSTLEKHDFYNDTVVSSISGKCNVSREVILRRALDFGYIDQGHYDKKAAEFAKYAKTFTKTKGGGNYYRTQATYLGRKYLKLAFSHYYQRRISEQQLAGYLNIKVRSISGLENIV